MTPGLGIYHDAVKSAATDYASYDPDTETGRLAGERAEQAKEIREHAEKKAKEKLDKRNDEKIDKKELKKNNSARVKKDARSRDLKDS